MSVLNTEANSFRASLQSHLAQASVRRLLVVFIGGYIVLLMTFALIYQFTGIREAAGARAGFGQVVYYSGTTQATLGLGDILPASSFSEVVTVAQSAVGAGYFATAIALVVARLLLPSERGLIWDKKMIFNPIRHYFWISFRNNSSRPLRRVTCDAHWIGAARGNPEVEESSVPYEIPANSRVILRTRAIRLIVGKGRIGDLRPDPMATPQPGDFGPGQALMVELEFTSPMVTRAAIAHTYHHDMTLCGVIDEDDKFYGPDSDPEMELYCGRRCVFRLSCRLPNKASGWSAARYSDVESDG